jgi:hypothetical protein
MTMKDQSVVLAARWVRIALVYFLLAVGLGVAMAATHDFRLKGLHVHLNLLGWVSMAITGSIYRLFPQAAATRLAAWHFGLYNAALPVMMTALACLLLGWAAAEPVVAVSSIALLVAVLLFALNIWRLPAGSLLGVEQFNTAAQ